LKLTTDRHEVLRGLSATAELFVKFGTTHHLYLERVKTGTSHMMCRWIEASTSQRKINWT